jgi:hypothetical protein
MSAFFGPNTSRVLTFIARLSALSPEQMDLVTRAWKQASSRNRAEAWARICRVTSAQEQYRILAAASLARREAMDIARQLARPDWTFWAAAHDAAAAIATGNRIGRHCQILTAPFAVVMPSLGQYPDHPRHAPAGAMSNDRPQQPILGEGA